MKDFMPKEKRMDISDIEIERLRGAVSRGASPATSIAEREELEIARSSNPNPGGSELFVKIDEHKAVGQQIVAAKKDIKALSETIATIARAEKTRSDAMEKVRSALDTLDSRLRDIDAKLAPPPELRRSAVPAATSSISEAEVEPGDEADVEELRSELGEEVEETEES